MDNVDIIIFDEEDVTRTLIESYLNALTFPCNLQKYNEFDLSVLDNDEVYKIAIVNINTSNPEVFNKISEVSCNKKLKIIAMSFDGSANLQVRAFRAGAKDFLIKPLIKDDFVKSVQEIYSTYIYKSDKNAVAKVFTAISNRKGDGKSGFLVNLAKEIADVSNEKVLLIDFNNSKENISFLLNTNMLHSTGYYINNLSKDNAQALLSTVTKYKDSSLYIMADGFAKNKSIPIKKDKLINAFNILKHHYRYILMDKMPDDDTIENETLINISDEVFCIILPFISSFDKIRNILENYYKNKNIKIILNQYTTNEKKFNLRWAVKYFGKFPKIIRFQKMRQITV